MIMGVAVCIVSVQTYRLINLKLIPLGRGMGGCIGSRTGVIYVVTGTCSLVYSV